jgi:hypothetical protein
MLNPNLNISLTRSLNRHRHKIGIAARDER